MAQTNTPIILSDDEDDNIAMPIYNHLKKRDIIVVDDPTPSKLQKSVSSIVSLVPETPPSVLSKLNVPSIVGCTSNLPIRNLSGDDVLICVGSDDEVGGFESSKCSENTRACAGFIVENELKGNLECNMKEKPLENKEFVQDIDLESWLDIESTYFLHKEVVGGGGFGKRSLLEDNESLLDSYLENLQTRSKSIAKETCQEENEKLNSTSHVEYFNTCPPNVQSTCHLGQTYNKSYDNASQEDDIIMQHVQNHDDVRENVRREKGCVVGKPKRGDKDRAIAEKKQKKEEQAANRKKLMEEKRLKKEQEKAEVARLKQLEKEKKKLEKYKLSEKDIVAEIDLKVLSGSLGGPLLTMFDEKRLCHNLTSNPIEKSIVWRLTPPQGMSQCYGGKTDIQYILLIYDDAEEFCKSANDGSLINHISSVRNRYPSYTICCLTNRLMSFINKREQQKYKYKKEAINWQRPPVEQLFAKLSTQFTNVHTRLCVDEAEVAEHVAGLTINLAKCHSRKKLTHLSVNANGCNVPKDCVDRGLIMKNPWLKALVSIPKVQPRFAIAIWKKYPTLKSLLRVYMDPTKTVDEKESLLEDLPLDDLGSHRRLGEKCSKRVFRILMAQNGGLNTDDTEHGADFFQK
ncbi:crossover junction endonuclease EME1B-like [Amaranthus tricolor]|uniref:crossover junction endonuclease EME1B-like n=1 Tax=Amaranthus tricolor TaxID=29722 RepID=UPI00258786C5|nr:crossover junction endonuclease EME1B-like [Amaranthus tricolor]XP_057531012.1 crossover junction endonuclease EME1B-like [Amaranthus tricolor]XP_057531013.1 crossover junction endonuclease EME1B-like [Amaranthus tricolor]